MYPKENIKKNIRMLFAPDATPLVVVGHVGGEH